MIVKIFTLKNGLQVIENVTSVRIKSKEYNLLIFKDYVSIMGRINGNCEIDSEGETLTLENIKAYYVNSNNVFNLMFEDE